MTITLFKPKFEDLWFRKALLADERTMSYNRAWGGAIDFPEENWKSWYGSWVSTPEDRRYYRYVKDENGNFIGEIAYHFDPDLGGNIANVIIHSEYRNKGYGSMALDMLCKEAKDHGIDVLYDDIAKDNPAIKLFLGHGFEEVGRTDDKIILRKKL